MTQSKDKLIMTSRGRIELLDKSEIFYVSSERHKIHIHMLQCEIFTFHQTLDNLEQMMDDSHFLRIHQSFLINTRFVSRVDGPILYMNTGEQFPVSRRYLATVHRHFKA